MIPLYSEGRWALLPTMDTMASMCDLFSANSKCATKDRIHFTTVCSPYVLKWPLNNPRSHSPKRSIHFNSCPLSRKATSLYLSTVNGVAHTFPFTHSPVVKTTLHPCFVWKRCEDYLIDGHNDACPTTGLTELDRGNITVGTAVELKRAINILWFQATTREVSSPRSYAETRPDPTGIPESEGEKAIRWFQDNILPSADGPFNEDIGETDMRVLKKMHVWHSTVMPPSKNGDGEMTSDQARASLLEENLLTDEEDCHDNASTSALIKTRRAVITHCDIQSSLPLRNLF